MPPRNWDTFAEQYTRNCTPFCSLHAFDLLTALLPVLSSKQQCNILDIACGGAALSLAYLRLFPQGVDGHQFISTDLSPVMVDYARTAINAAKPESCKTAFQFRVDDGTKLETVDDQSIDVAISAFGVFLIPDRTAVLTQINRVLRKGGVFGMTAWTKLPELPSGFGLDFEEIMFGGAKYFLTPPGKPPKDGSEAKLGGPAEIWRKIPDGEKALSDANFQNIRSWKSLHTASFRDFQNIWSTISCTPLVDLSTMSKEAIDSAHNTFRSAVFSKAGIKLTDDHDAEHMILLVSASVIYIGSVI